MGENIESLYSIAWYLHTFDDVLSLLAFLPPLASGVSSPMLLSALIHIIGDIFALTTPQH